MRILENSREKLTVYVFRSNPATYCGFFTDIRQLFASMPEAKIRGYIVAEGTPEAVVLNKLKPYS